MDYALYAHELLMREYAKYTKEEALEEELGPDYRKILLDRDYEDAQDEYEENYG